MRVLMLALLLPLLSFAQPPRGFFAWWDSPFARDLNLSDAQKDQIRNILRDYRKDLIDERANVEKAELDIEGVMDAENFDSKAANSALDRLVTARAAMTRSFTEMGFKLRTVLTAEQWKQVQQRSRRSGRDRMNPGERMGRPESGRPSSLERRGPPIGGPPPLQ